MDPYSTDYSTESTGVLSGEPSQADSTKSIGVQGMRPSQADSTQSRGVQGRRPSQVISTQSRGVDKRPHVITTQSRVWRTPITWAHTTHGLYYRSSQLSPEENDLENVTQRCNHQQVVIPDCCTPLFQFLFVISFEHSAAFEDQRPPLINRFLNNRGCVVIYLLITGFFC
jgi:hypothetical protein